MKKLIFIQALAFLLLGSISAQENEEKGKSKELKLEAGTFAFGMDAIPYIEFLGNMFNNTDNNSLNIGTQNLYFKYLLSSESALRLNFSINNYTNNDIRYVADDAMRNADPLSTAQVTDTRTRISRDMSIMLGYQRYIGKNKLKGYYGGQLGLSNYSSAYDYVYGNPTSGVNQVPSSSNFSGNLVDNGRVLNITNSASTSLSGGLFCGIEYFFSQAVSAGLEGALSYNYSWYKQTSQTIEEWDGSKVDTYELPNSPSSHSTSIYSFRPASYAGIYVMFYF